MIRQPSLFKRPSSLSNWDRQSLRSFLIQFAKEHPSDGWGGYATSAESLRQAANVPSSTTSDVEAELRDLHINGSVYLQRWDWDRDSFQPLEFFANRFFDNTTFRLLPSMPN